MFCCKQLRRAAESTEGLHWQCSAVQPPARLLARPAAQQRQRRHAGRSQAACPSRMHHPVINAAQLEGAADLLIPLGASRCGSGFSGAPRLPICACSSRTYQSNCLEQCTSRRRALQGAADDPLSLPDTASAPNREIKLGACLIELRETLMHLPLLLEHRRSPGRRCRLRLPFL